MDFHRIFDILDYQQKRYPHRVAMAGREDGNWRTWSTESVISERDSISVGLLRFGLQAGDRVAMLAHCGSPRWMIADAAMLQVGIVPVPIHTTARPDEIAHIVKDTALKGCFVSNQEMLDRITAAGLSANAVFLLEDKKGAVSTKYGGKSWSELLVKPDESTLARLQELRSNISPETLATILYTSGTTGLPKGVMLSHENIVSNVKSVLAIVPVGPETTSVSFLPMSHIFERMVTYTYLAAGVPIWFSDSMERLPKTMMEVRPHFFTAVPRVLERMYERLIEERDRKNKLSKKIMDWAIALGERFPYSGSRAMPLDYRLKRILADILVFRSWRKRMGGRVQYIAVGAAALRPRLGRLFSAARIEVREGYGLTETSPVISFNRFEPGGVHFGTVGIPAPGVEVRIAAEQDEAGNGEVEVQGNNIMMGYWQLPAETAERFTPDGWFKTGDIGRFEYKRFLKITGRKSEIFKTTTGKFVAPGYVEQQLLGSQYISQCMVLGLNQPFVGALIVPNFQHLEAWCLENQVHWTSPQYMVLNPKIEKFFREEIERINEERLGPVEKIRAFTLLHENWTTENGLLTPTLKVRRDRVEESFKGEIGKMFRE
ncbi:MAG: long-chain fatty acid--CoA ligase [Lewinellaceae bacterium]|nr:long-chain fatty acid--CoA ligase [Saprospiraceae bacterium]MCB9342769.1 long-chain fatty acid--CoA ligase [Lewinellaceae bacterium]